MIRAFLLLPCALAVVLTAHSPAASATPTPVVLKPTEKSSDSTSTPSTHSSRRTDLLRLDKLNQHVVQLYEAGKYSEAIPLAERVLQLREKALGPEHSDTAESLNNLAELYKAMGEYAKAERLYQRALQIREKAFGQDHPVTAESFYNMAGFYENTGDYARAERLYQQALRIDEKALGPDHTTTALDLHALAGVYQDIGDYSKAESLYQHALKIREKALGPDHPDTAVSLSALAELYDDMGEYAKAEALHQRALKIREKALGPDHPDTAESVGYLAGLYQNIGDYAKSESLCQRALRIREKALGPEHPVVAQSLNSLSGVYAEIGDYAKAESCLQRALQIYQKALGPQHRDTATALNNLALLCQHRRDYAKAEPLYQRALQIREKILGPEHPDTANALNNLATVYENMGDYTKAEALCQRALKIDEKALGPEHPQVATNLTNLAWLYNKGGDYAKAEPLLQRALRIREKAVGPDHPDTALNLTNLAYLHYELGDRNGALDLSAQARRANEKTLSNILSFTSEQQRLEFQRTTNPYSLPATLGSAPELAEIVLRQKAVVLDSLLEDRLIAETSRDPEQRGTIEQLRATKQHLTQLELKIPKDLSQQAQKQRESEKKKLSAEVEQLEAGLARHFAGLGKARRALNVTVPQVQSVLPARAALIELLRYMHYLGKDSLEARYGAILIGATGEPVWVPLGSATQIEKSIMLYRKSAQGKTDESTLSGILRELENQVWEPIARILPAGTTTVIVSPDAALNFVSFATLLTPDDRFVSEKYSIRYVASGRDLLKQPKQAAASRSTMQVFANPDFEAIAAGSPSELTNDLAQRSVDTRDLQRISFRSLPGTAKEAAELDSCAKKSGWQLLTYLGQNATKVELRKVHSPQVLHLATHGFFLPEIDLGKNIDPLQPNREIPAVKLLNPMFRSGLALAGAQRTLQAWAKGEVPETDNDGIVTAEDVGELNLDGTWLVVLSACDTGLGQAWAGEGVMGLRRGFIQAGAQNLLMTLWPINDQTTVKMMVDFYSEAFKTGNAPQALADTERDWLVKLRKDVGLAQAVHLAGSFIMSSQGNQ